MIQTPWIDTEGDSDIRIVGNHVYELHRRSPSYEEWKYDDADIHRIELSRRTLDPLPRYYEAKAVHGAVFDGTNAGWSAPSDDAATLYKQLKALSVEELEALTELEELPRFVYGDQDDEDVA